MTSCTVALVVVAFNLMGETPAAQDNLAGAIQQVRNVGPDSKGSDQAASAWRVLSKADASQLPELLAGMDGANALARNWLRAAIGEILDRARMEQKTVPQEALESFLRDTQHDPQARRLAYELIIEHDRTASERFLPNMLDDPSPELRRDAVARLIDQAEKVFQSAKKKESLATYKKCLASARDKKQIDKIAGRLRELGEPVDLATHLGFIMEWKLLGSFPNVKQKGIGTVYPAEEKIDLTAAYDGKSGKVNWKDYVTPSDTGIVDLYAGLGKHQEGTAYALAEFTSAAARAAEIRLGCFTAFKLWVNGEMVLQRGDAYTGMSVDHYSVKVHLRPGKNVFLLKLCRDDFPQAPDIWQFQVRVCDETGAAVLSANRPPRVTSPKKS